MFIRILAAYRYVAISVFHTVLTGNLGVEENSMRTTCTSRAYVSYMYHRRFLYRLQRRI